MSSVMAQKETRKCSVGFGIEVGAPTGGIADLYKLGFGITARVSFHAGPGFVTLTSGAIGYSPKSIVAGQTIKVGLEIPVKAGYKYINHHFFAMGELGYAEFKSYYGKSGSVVSSSSGSFIAGPTVGVQFNAFEAGIRYEMISGNGSGGFVGLRIGFNF